MMRTIATTLCSAAEPDTSKAGAEFSIIAYDGTPCKIRISDNGRGGALMTHDGRVAFDIIDDAGNVGKFCTFPT